MTDASELKTLAATKSWGRGRVYDSIAETIGHTPLVRLSKVMKAAKTKADILIGSAHVPANRVVPTPNATSMRRLIKMRNVAPSEALAPSALDGTRVFS